MALYVGSPVRCGVCNVWWGLHCVVGSAVCCGVYSVLSCLRCAVGSVVYYGVYTVLWGLHGAWDLQCVMGSVVLWGLHCGIWSAVCCEVFSVCGICSVYVVCSVLWCLQCVVGSIVLHGLHCGIWSAVYRRLCRVLQSPTQAAKACDDSGASCIATLSVLCQISPINSKFPFKIRLGTDKK